MANSYGGVRARAGASSKSIDIPHGVGVGSSASSSDASSSFYVGTPLDSEYLLSKAKELDKYTTVAALATVTNIPSDFKEVFFQLMSALRTWRALGPGGTYGFVATPDLGASCVYKFMPLPASDFGLLSSYLAQGRDEANAWKHRFLETEACLFNLNASDWERLARAGFFAETYDAWRKYISATSSGVFDFFKAQDKPEMLVFKMPKLGDRNLSEIQAEIFYKTDPETGERRFVKSDDLDRARLIDYFYPVARNVLNDLRKMHCVSRMIHGDIKAANIICEEEGGKIAAAQLGDLGSAKFVGMESTEKSWLPPSPSSGAFGVRSGVADVYIERLWAWDVDYYAMAFVLASLLFSPRYLWHGFKGEKLWYVEREKKLKILLNQFWDETLENPGSGLSGVQRFQGRWLVHAICQLLCLIKDPRDLEDFLNQSSENFNHKPLYLRAKDFYYETVDVPKREMVVRTTDFLYEDYKKNKARGALVSGSGSSSLLSTEELESDLRTSLLKASVPVGLAQEKSDEVFKDPIAQELFKALCPKIRSCCCFYKPDFTFFLSSLREGFSSFERQCLEIFETPIEISNALMFGQREEDSAKTRVRKGSGQRSVSGFSLPALSFAGSGLRQCTPPGSSPI